jgi:hypothetical protein
MHGCCIRAARPRSAPTRSASRSPESSRYGMTATGRCSGAASAHPAPGASAHEHRDRPRRSRLPARLDLYSRAGVDGVRRRGSAPASWRMDRLEHLQINKYEIPGLVPGLLGAAVLVSWGWSWHCARSRAARSAPSASRTRAPRSDARHGAGAGIDPVLTPSAWSAPGCRSGWPPCVVRQRVHLSCSTASARPDSDAAPRSRVLLALTYGVATSVRWCRSVVRIHLPGAGCPDVPGTRRLLAFARLRS